MESNNGEVFMGIDKNEWGFRVGHLPHGERNKISDVPGVTVGHCTLADLSLIHISEPTRH